MDEKRKDKMPAGKGKKVLIVILSIIVVVAAIIGVFAYKFRSHLSAAFIWLTSSDEEINENIDNAKNNQVNALVGSGYNASKELGDALESGAITAEQHTQILVGEVTLEEVLANNAKNEASKDSNEALQETENKNEDSNIENKIETPNTTDEQKGDINVADPKQEDKQPSKNENKNETSSQTTKPPVTNTQTGNADTTQTNEVDKRVAELVTKMYVLKAEYTGAVEGVVSSMKAEYAGLPAEQRTKSAKISIAERYMGQINAMEGQCDAQVNAIVTELRKLLKDNGRDTSLADAIVQSYETEKSNTKAYYLSTYGD